MTHFGSTTEPLLPKWMAVPLVLAVIAATGFLGWTLLPAGTWADTSYPKAWDKRVRPYVKLVEKKRGAEFQHPVRVRFLPDAEFRASVRADADDLTAEDLEEIENAEGMFRALGLIAGDVDLLEAISDARSGNTLAYYSFEDQRITVRGTHITPATKSTLVHELTHALQDQYFGIGDRFEKLQDTEEGDGNSAAASVLRAIVEGDAERIQARYGESLKKKASAALLRSRRELSKEADALTERQDVPEVVLTIMGAPYALGTGLVEAVAKDGGNSAVNDLLLGVLPHEDVLLDPFLLIDDKEATGPSVKIPKTTTAEKQFDSGEFGTLMWYLLLAERLPLRDALAAVAGWDGDAYVAYERDGVACARMAVRHGSVAGTDRMHQALRRWVAASPRSDASVTRDGSRLELESCDPGIKAAPGNNASQEAIQFVTLRNSVIAQLLDDGSSQKPARCVADRIVADYSVEQLVDPTFGTDAATAQRLQQIFLGCR